MSDIQLEVGKTYVVRNPEYAQKKNIDPLVTIEAEDHGSVYPFCGNDGSWYSASGELFIDCKSEFDLVAEVTP